jgi:hypothetical protein
MDLVAKMPSEIRTIHCRDKKLDGPDSTNASNDQIFEGDLEFGP